MNTSFRLTLLFGLLVTFSAVSGAFPTISTPYSMRIDGNHVRIQNLSDRYLQMRLTIEGRNFVSEFPCETRVSLGARDEYTLEVSAKNRTFPADYQILVTEFSAKTTAQLLSEQKEKLLPAPMPMTPATPAIVEKMQVIRCQSP